MSGRTSSVIGLAMVAVYAILIGTGAFFQYSASMTFKQILGDNESTTISPEDKENVALVDEHTQKSKISNELKTAGRLLLIVATIFMSVLLLMKKMELKYYYIATVGSMVAGIVLTLPWWLMSGAGIMNYYLEQLAFCGMSMAIVIVVSIANKMLAYTKS